MERVAAGQPAELLCVLWLWSGLLCIVLYCGGQGCFVCNINTWVALCANSHQQAAAVSKSNSGSSSKGRKIAKFWMFYFVTMVRGQRLYEYTELSTPMLPPLVQFLAFQMESMEGRVKQGGSYEESRPWVTLATSQVQWLTNLCLPHRHIKAQDVIIFLLDLLLVNM